MPTRRAFLETAGAAAASAALARAAAQDAVPAPDEWPQFRGDPRLTGVARSPAPPLDVLWTHDAGPEGVDSSAAIAGGRVYLGTNGGRLLALDLGTGARQWAYETGEEVGESSPCVVGGVVYVGDRRGVVHAVGAADGRRRWTFATGAEVRASPVVSGGLVLVGSYDSRLRALDPATGEER